MILYALLCDYDHDFEGWFSSSEAYADQVQRGQIACPHCGSVAVRKAIMAPNVVSSKKLVRSNEADQARQMAEAAHKLGQYVAANFDYVGDDFADEARNMHIGLTPHRAIYGEADAQAVKALVEEGIAVAPLPIQLDPDKHKALPSKRNRLN